MYARRWPLIAAVIAAVLVVGAIGWAIGRSSTSGSSAQAHGKAGGEVPMRMESGVPVGVKHSRAGALAAADNYVATSSETVLQDPARYDQLVRAVYAPSYQATAIREARIVRAKSPTASARYDAGGRAIALIAARRLDRYDGARATITTWRSGVIWGGGKRSEARWFLSTMTMRWDGGRWLVEAVADIPRVAPAPVLIYSDAQALKASTFDRELRGMTAPDYGVGE